MQSMPVPQVASVVHGTHWCVPLHSWPPVQSPVAWQEPGVQIPVSQKKLEP
jgi:hypothetical protein